MQRRITALLFDKDGTLFDFAGTWRGVVEAVLRRLAPDEDAVAGMAAAGGFDPVTGRFAPGSPVVAGATREIAAAWAPFRPDLDIAAMERELNRVAIGLVSEAQLVPASRDLGALLAGLLQTGYTLGVATNASEAEAHRQLDAARVRAPFGFVAGYDSVAMPKPAPDMALAFAAAVGVTPSSVAMIGDSTHDIECGRAAGCGLCIGVLTGPAEEADLAPHADHVIPSIDDLPGLLARL